MSLDVPVLANKLLLGGWQYINDKTGAFFTDENDVVEKYLALIEASENGKLSPSQWFQEYSEIMPYKLQGFLELSLLHNDLEQGLI